jgi:hypothetical protein
MALMVGQQTIQQAQHRQAVFEQAVGVGSTGSGTRQALIDPRQGRQAPTSVFADYRFDAFGQ